ncbi:glycosyltransferase family 2 protein [Janthinobacterium sp. SUN033]|uniref:glycosyltransferase family 2 protein n=1 Tax=Janthinobacterium sp. SUN033 TaxID=3002439 RepID=UPI0025AF523D|nr:glycosyltransferase family 2 protein [Janthinobacterium sp. SUN033]MDN2679837.1 glycosyltransferase family 2 protein [Janthinobacterium sp. SUN033]
MTPQVGLVTVLFNSADVLPGFFESLTRQKFLDYWLFIIDNSLDDLSFLKSQELIKKTGMQNVTLIKNDQNVGVAKANNQGIALSLKMQCEHVLLLNNDIEFKDADLLSRMLALAKKRDEKIVVPKIYFHDSGLIWCAGGEIKKWRGSTIHRGEGDADIGQYDMAEYTAYAPTCFMLIHASVFEKVGIMDERYFVYYDDTDFVLRCNQNNIHVYYWPEGQVWHKVSSSTGGDMTPFSVYFGSRNRIYFIKKNYPAFVALVALTFFILTRFLKFKLYRLDLRKKLISGIFDGFKM